MVNPGQEMMTSEEHAIAFAELQIAGHIEWVGEGDEERFTFTDSGLEDAWKLWFGLPPKDRLTLFLLTKLIIEAGTKLDQDTV